MHSTLRGAYGLDRFVMARSDEMCAATGHASRVPAKAFTSSVACAPASVLRRFLVRTISRRTSRNTKPEH